MVGKETEIRHKDEKKKNNLQRHDIVERKSNYSHTKSNKWEIDNPTSNSQINIEINGFKMNSLNSTLSLKNKNNG